ncbi:MAG: DNA primase [Candidatus Micrarchaeota archaeon]|nr:DNA primase [Candidatus Micrarchaeota archaeon]MDE1847972.1 DNA primase [Candidatus Micrarchaeota archaeon]MDE1864685.1 DNA primase [Candidatus Micrarchaeota archaeon]
MAKTYLDIVKYMIGADFGIDGLVDKPDIIGAVFGQTEGLLGDELDLRELQKNGKMGRIEIEMSQNQGKTYGKLFLPASLDRIETCILAAAVESVDRVGPYDARFKVGKVEDTRTEKRRKLLERAKELVRALLTTEMPDSKELSELVQADVKTSEITSYGPEGLPAGPDVAKSNEVILVEGRADVLNLLRNDITNAVAIGGATSIARSLIKLCNEREITVFLDGDKGGDMILRTLLSVAEVDYVAKAPEGKEVEELQRKEVIKALRVKVPIDQYLGMNKTARPQNMPPHQARVPPRPQFGQQSGPQPLSQQNMQSLPQQNMQPRPQPQSQPISSQPRQFGPQQTRSAELVGMDDDDTTLPKIDSGATLQRPPQKTMFNTQVDLNRPSVAKPAMESMVLQQLSAGLDELSGTLRSRLYATDGSVARELPIRELVVFLQESADRGLYGIVLDGVITQRLVELALMKNVHAIYGLKANPMPKKHPELIIYTKEQGRLE